MSHDLRLAEVHNVMKVNLNGNNTHEKDRL